MGESIGMEPTPASLVPQKQTRWLGLKGSAKVPEGWMGKEEGHGDGQTGDRQRQLFKGGRANRAHKSWHFIAGKASLEQPQIPFTIYQGCWHWDVHILGPSSPALGFVWKRKARAERCCTYVHPLPARSCPWQLAGTSAQRRPQRAHIREAGSPLELPSFCLPGPGGCGLSSVVSVQDFGFSRDVSSLSRYACLWHAFKNIADEYITSKISHHWAALFRF